MVTGDSLFQRVRVYHDLGDECTDLIELEKTCEKWRDDTLQWLYEHDRRGFALFGNDSGLIQIECLVTRGTGDRCLSLMDLRLARLRDIAIR
jgi:hypothetical protein